MLLTKNKIKRVEKISIKMHLLQILMIGRFQNGGIREILLGPEKNSHLFFLYTSQKKDICCKLDILRKTKTHKKTKLNITHCAHLSNEKHKVSAANPKVKSYAANHKQVQLIHWNADVYKNIGEAITGENGICIIGLLYQVNHGKYN